MQIKDLPASAAVNAADVFAKDTNAATTNKITAQNLADGLLPLSGGLPASSAAIIIQGDKTTHATGAAIGDYVYVLNSTIANRPDGLYKAAKAIPYNTTIDSSYLTQLPNGGYNALNADLASLNSQIETLNSKLTSLIVYVPYSSFTFADGAFTAPASGYFPSGYTFTGVVVTETTEANLVLAGRVTGTGLIRVFGSGITSSVTFVCALLFVKT